MTAIFRFWKWIFYFLIISCSFVLDGVGQACDRERDSLALVDLYNATGGENWTYTKTTYWDALSSQIQPIPNIGKIWDFDAPINTWYGIEVNQNRCVTKLILPSCGLVGELSSKIGELSDLSGLHINGNSLTGEIPKELGLLSNLNILELRNNRLTGEIPIELGNLSNLIELSIGVNDFDGALPFELGNLSNLRWFSAFFCGLKGEIPKSIGNMVSLENIDLSSNSLSGHIPIEIKNLLKLKGIFFSSNNLIGNIPSELGALNNLEALLLSRNAFSESIPKELGNLPNLTRIDISFNQLNGCFHSSLNTLCELGFNDSLILGTIGYNFSNNPQLPWQGDFTRFCNEENQISALCEDRNPNTQDDQIQEDCICQGKIIEDNCRTRDSLVLVSLYNATDGANWTNKWDLNQPMNTWFGVHLTAQGCVSALILHGNGDLTLEASEVGNNLSGTIPTSIGMLSELRTLNLRGSNLIGELPCELGELQNLTGILLEDNQFSGEIPSSLGTIPALGTAGIGYLGLTNNQLSGCFPESLMALCDIQVETFGNPDLSWQGDFSRFCSGEVDLNCTLQSLNCDKDNCRTQDSLVLVALYNSTDGPNWTNSWDLNQPMDTWFGINLNDKGCVVIINLTNNELNGNIPSDIGNLASLTMLYMPNNTLFGNIPIEFGNLLDLQILVLANNQLNGKIPSILGSLIKLEILNLGANNLSGNIPSEIGNLNKLIELSLQQNSLDGSIPVALANLNSLKDLILFQNKLNGLIPSELSNIPKLRNIELSSNQLTGIIPLEFGKFTNLETLSLSDNQLSGSIPIELTNILSLKQLNLNVNQLNGVIPNEIGRLFNLEALVLYGNQLSGAIPKELGNLQLLESLLLEINQLSGPIPDELGNLNNLTGLWLYSNQLSGEIPSSLGNLSNIERLYLHDNQLSGCFPPELLFVCEQGFSENVNAERGYNFTNNSQLPWQGDFTRFCNGENQIGAICDDGDNTSIDDKIQEDCSCQEDCRTRDSLSLVALYNATDGANWTNKWNLNQPMNTWYGITLNNEGCVSILHLCEDCVCAPCDGNNLNGTLPDELGNLSELTSFAIVDNPLLVGPIPSSISNLQKVTFFSLEGNRNISGTLPTNIGNMTELRDLRIGLNRISGEIPASFYDLRNLHSIWGGPNELTGSLSERIADLPLINLAFGPNNFTGPIPDVFDKMPQLQRLFLEENTFVGIIPPTLGTLTALTHLNFSDNDLSGCFPESLRNLCSLKDCTDSKDCSIDFSNNPQLPWQGDFARFCNGENQIGAVCNDGDVNTSEDQIQEDCSCFGSGCIEPMNLGRITEVEQLVTCDENIFLEDIASASTVATYETNPTTVEVGISDSPGVFFDNLEIGINTINIISDTFNCTYYTPTTIELIRLTQPNLQEDRIGIDNTLSQHVFSVIENDDLIPNTRFTIEVVSPVSRGDLDNRRDGTFVYTPPANFTGVANFDYRLCYDDCMTYCDQATVLLDVSGDGLNDDGFTIPEAFTPNDDGVNDEFIIPALRDEPEKYPKNELIVINRWGDQVFYAKPYNNDWRGTNQKGKPLPAATYYYIIRLDISEGDIVRGEVTLIR